MKNIALTSDIKSLIVDVSEEIKKKNLLNFIHTSLDINNIEYSNTDVIYSNYLLHSKQYQIFIFSNSFKYMIIELLNFKDKKCEEDKKYDELNNRKDLNSFKLYISKTFFVIYKNDKLYTYQTLNQEYSKDELVNFIKKSFNVTISIIEEIKDSDLEKVFENIKDKKVNSSFFNINKKSNKSFILYLAYLLFCICSTVIYTSYESKSLLNDKLQKTDIAKKEYLEISKMLKFKPFKNEYEKLITTADKFKLKISSINYNRKSISIKLSTENKNSIYLFLNVYKENLLGNSIVKHDTQNIFESTINVQIN